MLALLRFQLGQLRLGTLCAVSRFPHGICTLICNHWLLELNGAFTHRGVPLRCLFA